jgi:exopolyphosphatase/guanosine-5'-triphosphate,3'-diphosphate pyrophosphatase
VLDLGGGSLQLVRVDRRLAQESGSWRLGTVRMTERFLPDDGAAKKQLKALRGHVAEELAGAPWLATSGERLVALGGTVRNLAAAAQHRAGLPSFGVQGFVLTREALGELVNELAGMPASERGRLRGIKPERGDVILAGAATVAAVLEAGSFEAVEVTQEGLREGVFFESYLAPADPPLVASVREASVRNLATQYDSDEQHVGHVAALTMQMFDALAAAGMHPGDPGERELLWAAAMLHDIGVAVDYDDHHKHSRYLILNAGLPGFTPREVALIAQVARYHRKGSPGFGELAPLIEDGDDALLQRCSALLRLAEQLERSRDQLVHETRVDVQDGTVRLELVTGGDVSVARWAAQRQADLFESAFGKRLEVTTS